MAIDFATLTGVTDDVLKQAVVLTVLCFILPVGQIIALNFLKCFHPTIKVTKQELAKTKEEFKKMAESLLINDDNGLKKVWLVEGVTELTANNYQKADIDDSSNVTFSDDKGNIKFHFDPNIIIDPIIENIETNDETTSLIGKKGSFCGGKKRPYQTAMMKVLNHQIRVFAWINALKQINLGLVLSDETNTKRKRISFGDHIDELRTITHKPRFPQCLDFKNVRAMKKPKKDEKGEDIRGLTLTPIILAEEPWRGLQEQLNVYCNAFLFDVFLLWVKIYSSVVILKVVLAMKPVSVEN